MTHELKIIAEYLNAIMEGTKTFEIRKNDRNFKLGDHLLLRAWSPIFEKYTGGLIEVRITYISYFNQKEGYVVMSIKKCGGN